MPAVTGAFPYNIDNLIGGAVRVLYAPIDQALPVSIAEVIDMESPYDPATGWIDFGATKESFTYSRGFDTAGYEIQQVQGAVLEEVTDITRTIGLSLAELVPETLAIFEEAGAPAAVVAAAGVSAQERVEFGSFSSTTSYRVAFVARRHKSSGIVVESTDVERGRFLMGVGYHCSITAEDVSFEGAKGELTAVGLTFKLFPESGQVTGKEYGCWLDEAAGTIGGAG